MNGKTLTSDTAYLRLVQETTRAIDESKIGKGTVFENAQEAIEDLHRLQKSYARKKTTAI